VEVVDDELIRAALRDQVDAGASTRDAVSFVARIHSAWRTALSIRWRWHFEPTTPSDSLSLSDGSLLSHDADLLANDAPHVGNAYTTVNADALARCTG